MVSDRSAGIGIPKLPLIILIIACQPSASRRRCSTIF
jgi:hypothetical protein